MSFPGSEDVWKIYTRFYERLTMEELLEYLKELERIKEQLNKDYRDIVSKVAERYGWDVAEALKMLYILMDKYNSTTGQRHMTFAEWVRSVLNILERMHAESVLKEWVKYIDILKEEEALEKFLEKLSGTPEGKHIVVADVYFVKTRKDTPPLPSCITVWLKKDTPLPVIAGLILAIYRFLREHCPNMMKIVFETSTLEDFLVRCVRLAKVGNYIALIFTRRLCKPWYGVEGLKLSTKMFPDLNSVFCIVKRVAVRLVRN